MILEDCVMLARTVPEPSKKYGVRVCSVMYSPELRKLIRVYPLLPSNKLPRRHIFRMHLERNEHDSRDESYKKVSFTDTGKELSMQEVRSVLEKLISPDIVSLNEQKKSLGVILAENGKYFAEMRSKKNAPDPNQLCLFGVPDLTSYSIKTGKDYDHIPYLVISHFSQQKAIQLREWQIYMLLEKKGGVIDTPYLQGIFNNQDSYLVIGNLNGCRTIWIACAYFNYKVKPPEAQQRLF